MPETARTATQPGEAPILGPVTLPTAAATVADRLVTAIALGQFTVGERLPPERELAATLEVSRTTLREAVRRLVESGYVRVERGRSGGTFVESAMTGNDGRARAMIRRTLAHNWDQLEQLLDFRTLIESEIARTAAVRRSARDVDAIRAAVVRYAEAGPDHPSSSAADRHLHQTIAAATHNPYLAELSLQIRRDVTLGFGTEPWSPQLRERALVQHPELAQAVIDGDVVRSGLLAAEHWDLTEHTIRELLASVRQPTSTDRPPTAHLRRGHADRSS